VAQEPLVRHWPAGKFKTMSCCHLDAIRAAAAEDAALVFVMPDNLYSDGALARVGACARQGERALLLATFPVLEPSFRPALERAFPADAAGVRVLPARDLARLALAHSHPWNRNLAPGPSSFHVSSQLHWPVPGEGILARAWHLHPLFIQPRFPTTRFFHSIDNDWTWQVLGERDPVHIVQDSDEITCLEPLAEVTAKTTRPQPYPFSPLRWALACEGLFPSPHNRQWARKAIRWHGEDPSPAWAAAAEQAGTTVAEIEAWSDWLDPEGWPAPPLGGARLAQAEALCRQLRTEAMTFEQGGPSAPPACYSWANLAKLSGALGRREPAIQALREMVRLSPGNRLAAERAARLARALGAEPVRTAAELP
jgi:hypothetical protein